MANRECFIEIDSRGETAALPGKARTRVINENPSHHARTDGEKMGAIGEYYRPGINEPHERFIHERGGLERVIGAFASHVTARHLVKLAMNERHQLMKGLIITFSPSNQ